MTKDKEIIRLKAAGGVLYKAESFPREVLLMKRRGLWDLPKGKLEEGESIEECAVREVKEETGAKNLSIGKFLCETYHEFEENGKRYGKTTHWYSMKFDQNKAELEPQTEEEITELKWINLQKAKIMVEFKNLVDVLNEFQKQQNLS